MRLQVLLSADKAKHALVLESSLRSHTWGTRCDELTDCEDAPFADEMDSSFELQRSRFDEIDRCYGTLHRAHNHLTYERSEDAADQEFSTRSLDPSHSLQCLQSIEKRWSTCED